MFTLQELADVVEGQVLGDASTVIHAARPLNQAGEGDITFVENEKKFDLFYACKATAAVVGTNFPANGRPLIQVKDPLVAFVAIVRHLQPKHAQRPQTIDPRACVDATAIIGADPTIMPLAVVGARTRIGDRCQIHSSAVIGADCKIGDDVTIYPNAVIYDNNEIGDRAIVHANAVVGSDGFGYRFRNGRHVKVPQLGSVTIGADVEIGAGTTVDRGTFQATRIGDGTKIDNQVQIAHNCQIGKHNLLMSQVGIAGSTTTGDYVVMCGQVGIADNLTIGAGATIGARTCVIRDVPAGQRWLGYPAEPEYVQKRIWVTYEKLPNLRRDVDKIKKHLGLSDREP